MRERELVKGEGGREGGREREGSEGAREREKVRTISRCCSRLTSVHHSSISWSLLATSIRLH
jgi:hypothetical protein